MLRNIHRLLYSFWCLECWKWHFRASRFKIFWGASSETPLEDGVLRFLNCNSRLLLYYHPPTLNFIENPEKRGEISVRQFSTRINKLACQVWSCFGHSCPRPFNWRMFFLHLLQIGAQNAGNGISELPDLKMFWWSMPPDPHSDGPLFKQLVILL